MEKPQLVWRVGRTPTWDVALLTKPGRFGVGMSGRRLAELALKHDDGIFLPGHCWPGAGAAQPEGATKPCGTKIGICLPALSTQPLKSPPTSAGRGAVCVP